MNADETRKWVAQSRAAGMHDDQIRLTLRRSGWTGDQIATVLPLRPTGTPSTGHLSAPSRTPWLVWSIVFVSVVLLGAAAYILVKQDAGNSDTNNTNSLGTYSADQPKNATEQLAAESKLNKFENMDQLRAFLEAHAGSSISYQNTVGFAAPMLERSTASADLALGESELTKSSSSDYSLTNVQVEGVDEADIMKTDGQYVYAISQKNVYIINAVPAADAAVVATIALTSTPQDLYVSGNRLVIYGLEESVSTLPFAESIRPSSSYTFLKVFDISDKKNPKQIRDLDFEGSFANSRLIGDYVYFITTQPTYGIATGDYPIPMVTEGGTVTPLDSSQPKCNCPDIYYIDIPDQSYIFTTVTSINIKDADVALDSSIYLLNGTENMYVSQDNLYLVYTKYLSETQLQLDALREIVEPKLSARDKQRIQTINDVDSSILSKAEKDAKIMQVITNYVMQQPQAEQEKLQKAVSDKLAATYADLSKELEKTVIHKIAIDSNKLTYQGSGQVTGHVLNQFSMDEQDGYFRIATTKSQQWFPLDDSLAAETASYSNLYVLDANLKVVGKIEELAKGEQIYSARFMQGRAYLVTFKRTDPLFVIDLSKPEQPTLLGELKVPGFSSYLHPYDETTLIGFGKQADEDGRVTSLKISLFDVTDANNLKEVSTYEIGDSSSSSLALDDHHAFLFSKSKNLLVIPVSLQEQVGQRYNYTNGAMVFTVTKDKIEFRKRIDHSDGTAADNTSIYDYGYSYYQTAVKRSHYIDEVLYTLSDKYLKANALTDLAAVKSITLSTESPETDYKVIPSPLDSL